MILLLVLHIGAVIPLFASPTEYAPGRDEINPLCRGSPGHPQRQQKGRGCITESSLHPYCSGWNYTSPAESLISAAFPPFSSVSENKTAAVKTMLSWCHQGRRSGNSMLMELLRFSSSLAIACSWEWTQQGRQQGTREQEATWSRSMWAREGLG